MKQNETVERDVFYVIANMNAYMEGRGLMFVKKRDGGTTNEWKDAATADRYETRLEAEASIPRSAWHRYRPLRVTVETSIQM